MRPIAREFELTYVAEHVQRLGETASAPAPRVRVRLGALLVHAGFRLAPELRPGRRPATG